MKRIILVFILLMTATATFAQDKWQQKQIDYFVDSAVKEFGLTENQKKDLMTLRTTVVMAYVNSAGKLKNGEITADEKKEIGQQASRDFNSAMSKMTGKSYAELQPFFQKMQEEMKNVK
ncbi:hypothetical protein SLW70_15755 [Flavobacterium sp. NG2]|uniref:hypothetical protein n=1 Tax=Flavobacterium sp. NG2 TaxID=3097547 RepID=UPI002A8334E0|nr:hypothetical protein [Flavobacterium sp. NG2]WPR71369.1 hypothetical protein SLW70_15755 [Flavobacterium sp. NG2]